MKLNLFIIIILISIISFAQAQKAVIDKAAPDFTLTDSNGKKHSLSDFRGKYVVLEWINYDCPFVRKFYNSGYMQKLQKTYTAKDVIWFSICSSAPGKQGHFKGNELGDILKKKNIAATAYLLDEDGKVGKSYGAKTTPHMFIIDPDGILVYAGAIDDIRSTKIEDVKKARNYVVEALTALMNDKEVKTKTTAPYGCSVKY